MNIVRYERITKEIVRFVADHLEHSLTVTDIARQFNYSTEQLNRIIKMTLGSSPSHYIRFIKIEQAKSWLENSEKSVTEIANSLGYPYEQNFCRVFRNCVGTSPIIYRNLHQRR